MIIPGIEAESVCQHYIELWHGKSRMKMKEGMRRKKYMNRIIVSFFCPYDRPTIFFLSYFKANI